MWRATGEAVDAEANSSCEAFDRVVPGNDGRNSKTMAALKYPRAWGFG
jgi:hypothetical protein